MLNEIMNAVTCRLDELFPGIPIYTDAVMQGLEEPCFFVQFLEPSEKNMLGSRYYKHTDLAIQYLAAESCQSARKNTVLDTLMKEMEYIRLEDGSLMRGTNRSGRIIEGVVNFFVDYNCFAVRPKPKGEWMANLELNGGVSDDG